jgi:NAD(P)-dependent dehydrogenase (short-subunit alcohol dehydrogenase family)
MAGVVGGLMSGKASQSAHDRSRPAYRGAVKGQAAAIHCGTSASIGQPEDVAEAVVYLVGAGFVTGTVLECTGGSNLTAGALAG